jgi:hypothetical protein
MSAATPEIIRAAIGTIMKAVPSIGIVHPYERYAADNAGFAKLYMWHPGGSAAPELRGWFIRRGAVRQLADTSTQDVVRIDWQIRGYMAIQDAKASELTLDLLCEAVRNRFLASVTLGGLLDDEVTPPAPIGPQLVESIPVMFAGVLCHAVRFDWTTAYNTPIGSTVPADDPSIGEFRILHANWDVSPFGNVPPPPPADATADATDHIHVRPE